MDINDFKTFIVPSGIGDFAWIYMKLCDLPYKINIEVISEQDKSREFLKRSLPFLDLLPNIKSSRYLGYSMWFDEPVQEVDYNRLWIQANRHLEHGNRIETFLPELPTNLHFDINLPEVSDKFDIVLYTASLRASMNWRGWDFDNWQYLLELISDFNPNLKVAFVGANWDIDYLEFFQGIDDISVYIGRDIGEVLALIKKAKVLVGFPSGIPILSTIMKVPTFMFYPIHLEPMMYTFNNPSLNNYTAAVFGDAEAEVENVFGWIQQWL